MCTTCDGSSAPYEYKNSAIIELEARKGFVPTGMVSRKETPLQVAASKQPKNTNLPPELAEDAKDRDYQKLRTGQWIIVGVVILVTIAVVGLYIKFNK